MSKTLLGMAMPCPILKCLIFTCIFILSGCRKDEPLSDMEPVAGFNVEYLKKIASSTSSDVLEIRTGGDSTPITLTDSYAVEPDWNIKPKP